MPLSHEHVGSKILEKIKMYTLTSWGGPLLYWDVSTVQFVLLFPKAVLQNSAVKNCFSKFCLFDETELSCFSYNRKIFPTFPWVKHGLIWGWDLNYRAEKVQAEQAKKNTERTDSFSQLAECYLLRVVNLHTYGV